MEVWTVWCAAVRKNTLAIGKRIIRSKGNHIAVQMKAMITKRQEDEIRAVLDLHWEKLEPQIIQDIADVLGVEVKKGNYP
jgi:hypothetical protein